MRSLGKINFAETAERSHHSINKNQKPNRNSQGACAKTQLAGLKTEPGRSQSRQQSHRSHTGTGICTCHYSILFCCGQHNNIISFSSLVLLLESY